MSTQSNPPTMPSESQQDFAQAAWFAGKAVEAEDRNAAKFFHGLARFYWARCNQIS